MKTNINKSELESRSEQLSTPKPGRARINFRRRRVNRSLDAFRLLNLLRSRAPEFFAMAAAGAENADDDSAAAPMATMATASREETANAQYQKPHTFGRAGSAFARPASSSVSGRSLTNSVIRFCASSALIG